MNLFCANIISSVKLYSVSNEHYVLNKINGKSYLDDKEIFEKIPNKNIRINVNSIIKYGKLKEVFDINLKHLYTLNTNETFKLFSEYIYILEYQLNDKFDFDYSSIYIYQKGKKKLLCKFEKPITNIQYISDAFIYSLQGSKILSYFISTKNFLWQFPLIQFGTFKNNHGKEENYKVTKFIGVWNNLLLVACNNSLLLAIDIETGKLLHQWQYFKKSENQKAYRNEKLPDALDFQLDEKNDKLIASAYYSYLEIDLNTKEIQVTDMKEQLEEHGILSFNSTLEKPFSDTHMFSTVIIIKKPGNIFKNGLVAINRHTKKIDWFFTDEIFGTGTNSPKLAEDKLYQLTLDGKLYIFEKE